MSRPLDILSIGDIATDAFIKLKEAHVDCNLKRDTCELCLPFGGKVPYESVTVVPGSGNSANAGIAASRLGLNVCVVGDIGKDEHGKECLRAIEKNGVNTRYIIKHKKLETNYHYVLWYEAERTILIKHPPFPYSLPHIVSEPKWMYLTSIGLNSETYHDEIMLYLEKHPRVKLAFQPGTYQIKMGTKSLAGIYKRTNIFFCNSDEARKILGTRETDYKKLLADIRALGPETVVITDGDKGAHAYDGSIHWFIPAYPQKPFERTGAGDAFSGAVVSALALGKSFEEALLWGPINAASVIKHIGAIEGLLTHKEMMHQIEKAPADYKISRL